MLLPSLLLGHATTAGAWCGVVVVFPCRRAPGFGGNDTLEIWPFCLTSGHYLAIRTPRSKGDSGPDARFAGSFRAFPDAESGGRDTE